MQITHECPLNYLEPLKFCLPYDYALVHRLANPDYFAYFKRSVNSGRRVILDNSLFELGRAFDADQFLQWTALLGPDEVIAPDVFNDATANLASFNAFMHKFEKFFKKPGAYRPKVIGVAHGEVALDLIICIREMARHCNKIAIPFGSAVFEGEVWSDEDGKLEEYRNDTLYRKSLNRYKFIKDSLRSVFEDFPNLKLHLLGCHYPIEFKMYHQHKDELGLLYDAIETADTSHPVAAALEENPYEDFLYYKPKTKIDTLFDIYLTDHHRNTMIRNIKKFQDGIL